MGRRTTPVVATGEGEGEAPTCRPARTDTSRVPTTGARSAVTVWPVPSPAASTAAHRRLRLSAARFGPAPSGARRPARRPPAVRDAEPRAGTLPAVPHAPRGRRPVLRGVPLELPDQHGDLLHPGRTAPARAQPALRFQQGGQTMPGPDSFDYERSRPSQVNRPAEPIPPGPPFGDEPSGPTGFGGASSRPSVFGNEPPRPPAFGGETSPQPPYGTDPRVRGRRPDPPAAAPEVSRAAVPRVHRRPSRAVPRPCSGGRPRPPRPRPLASRPPPRRSRAVRPSAAVTKTG